MSNYITVVDIQNNTSISNAVDAKFLDPYIQLAEEMYVQKILGTALNSELKTAIDAVGITGLTGSQQTLVVNYIQPLAIWSTFFEAIPFLQFKIKAKGISKESSESIDVEEYGLFRTSVKDKVYFYRERLTEYLEVNSSIYSTYRTNENGNGKNNSSGIYLGAY